MADLGTFDLRAAKEAGHNDAAIADFLAAQSDFDLASARESGHDDQNIIQFLTTGSGFRDVTPASAVAEGINRGVQDLVSTLAGAPVDIANLALGGISSGVEAVTGFDPSLGSERPFGGSESIRAGLSTVFEPVGAERRGLEDIDPSLRPLGVAGEVVGGSILPGAAPFAIPAKAAGFLKPVVNLASTSPKAFIAAETAATGGAAAGGAVAELVDPGDDLTRFLAEVGGGIFNPTAAAARIGGKTFSSLKNVVMSRFKSGRENKAVQILEDVLEEAGETPDALVRLLNKADEPGVRLTSGQKTGSPALLAMERKLAEKSSRFAGEAEDLATNSMKTLREITDNLTKSGDPAALRTAAKLRARYFDDLLERRIQDAGQDALEARALLTGTKEDLADISTQAKRSLSKALEQARSAESSIWNKVEKDLPVDTQNLRNAVDTAKDRFLLKSEELPAIVGKELSRLAKEPANVGDALKFRSRLLSLSRSAGAKGDFNDKAVFDTIADGILRDLDEVPGGAATEARAFSRSLHEKFTQTFAGDALGTSGTGGERIPAEIMLERAFGSGGTKGGLRLQQLEEAGAFSGFGQPQLDSQEKFLNIAAQRSVGTDGRINATALQKFVSDNAATLNKFPDLKTKLGTVADAEDAFKGVEQASKVASNAITKRAAFANLLKTDDPVVAVGQALTGKNARRNYNQLAKLAKRSGKGSVEGLRSATLKTAFDKASDASGKFSFKRLNQILKTGLSKEDLGIIPLMKQSGVIDKATSGRLETLVARAIEIEDALKNQKKLDILVENPDGMFDLVLRIAGARLGSAGAVGSTGSSLIAASAGSKFARNFAQKIPATKVGEVLEEAARNPKFMALLLKKVRAPQSQEIGRQINAFLISAGIQTESEEQ